MLTIKKLRKSMGGRILFEEADMVINWGERIALVGANGTGKSTIFKIILGQEEKDGGTIVKDEYGMIGYLEQEAGNPGEATILEIATGINEEMRNAMATLREGIKNETTGSDEYGAAQDKYEELNGFQLDPQAAGGYRSQNSR